jgi:SAM-dependent methyltransferase
MCPIKEQTRRPFYRTAWGRAYFGNCLDVLRTIETSTIDLVLTSPPFALRTKKSYGNVSAHEYVDWFMPFATEIARVLKPNGSFVLDIGGSWNKGEPTRTLVLLNRNDDSAYGWFRAGCEGMARHASSHDPPAGLSLQPWKTSVRPSAVHLLSSMRASRNRVPQIEIQ